MEVLISAQNAFSKKAKDLAQAKANFTRPPARAGFILPAKGQDKHAEHLGRDSVSHLFRDDSRPFKYVEELCNLVAVLSPSPSVGDRGDNYALFRP